LTATKRFTEEEVKQL
jgi:hypothetical protein